MNKASLRTLGNIKNMMEQQEQFKRYMRLQEATRNYQLDRRTICEIAKECDALFKINTIVIIDIDAFEKHFREKYVVKEEE